MATTQPTEAQIAQQELIDKLDIHSIHKAFRNPHWKPNQRRNKNIKAIIGDATRREAASASIAATPLDNNSGTATPMDIDGGNGHAAHDDKNNNGGLSTSGTPTPVGDNATPPNLAQASRSLSKLVLEKSLKPNGGGGAATAAGSSAVGSSSHAPSATYTNIESAPSLAHTKRYCDITGLPAPYMDPKSRLRYHNREVFGFIRNLPQGVGEQYLEARGAHTVLK
ncbi:INO80 complex subunit C [Microdochium nivale]|nr:INO80 complex subunit C [Microdochium nivale]